MFNIGPAELLIIGLVLLIAVGPEQLPGVIRRVGSTVAQFRSMTDGLRSEFMAGLDEIERATDIEAWSDDEATPPSNNGSGADPASSPTTAEESPSDAGDQAGTADAGTADDISDPGGLPESDADDGSGPDRTTEDDITDSPEHSDLGTEPADEASMPSDPPLDEAPANEPTLRPSWGRQEGERA